MSEDLYFPFPQLPRGWRRYEMGFAVNFPLIPDPNAPTGRVVCTKVDTEKKTVEFEAK